MLIPMKKSQFHLISHLFFLAFPLVNSHAEEVPTITQAQALHGMSEWPKATIVVLGNVSDNFKKTISGELNRLYPKLISKKGIDSSSDEIVGGKRMLLKFNFSPVVPVQQLDEAFVSLHVDFQVVEKVLIEREGKKFYVMAPISTGVTTTGLFSTKTLDDGILQALEHCINTMNNRIKAATVDPSDK